MKRLLIILGTVVLVVGGLVAPAFAQTGEVGVTVQLAETCISVDPNSVGYRNVNVNDTGIVPVDPWDDPRINVHNCGSNFVDLFIRGDDSDDWALGDSPGVDTYVHYWRVGPSEDETYTPLTHEYQHMHVFTSYEPSCSQGFRLMMDTPTEVTRFREQRTSVRVLATMVEEGIYLELTMDAPSYVEQTSQAMLTATVVDQDNNPVSGIPSDRFKTSLKRTDIEENYGMQEVTFTEPDSVNNPGVYTGTLDISWLVVGSYNVYGRTHDDAMSRGCGGADFDITVK